MIPFKKINDVQRKETLVRYSSNMTVGPTLIILQSLYCKDVIVLDGTVTVQLFPPLSSKTF